MFGDAALARAGDGTGYNWAFVRHGLARGNEKRLAVHFVDGQLMNSLCIYM